MADTAQEGYVVLAAQSAEGTPATTVTAGLRVTSVDIGATTENIEADPEIGGNRDRDTAGVALGSFHVSGTIEGYVRVEQIGYLLRAAGWQPTGAPVADGDAYVHTFVPGVMTPLTIESAWGRNRLVRRFSDVYVDTLELTVAGDDFATFSAGVVGLAESVVETPSVPLWVTPDPIAQFLGSAAAMSDLATYRLSEMSVSIANNLSTDEVVIGQRALAATTPGRREVGFSGTIKPTGTHEEVTKLYRAAAYGSPDATAPLESEPYHTSTELTFGSTLTVGSSTVPYGLTVTMPDTVLNAFPLEASGADVLEASVEGIALAGEDPVATIVVRNARGTTY